METNENSSMAEIGQAKLINGAMELQAQVAENVAYNEHRVLHAQETQDASGGGGILGRISSAGESLFPAKADGANRASVYADMAFDAAGFGGAAQAGKMLLDAVKEFQDPHALKGSGKTFDQLISEGASKSPSTGSSKKSKKSIFTGAFNDKAALEGRAQGVNDFMKGPLKGVKSSESKFAEFSKRRELSATLKMVNAKNLAVANAMEAKVGAKIFKAQQLGIGGGAAQLALNKYQPKGPTEMSDVDTSTTTTDWA